MSLKFQVFKTRSDGYEPSAKMATDLKVQACGIPDEIMRLHDRTAINLQPKMATDLQVQACDIPDEIMRRYDRTAIHLQPKWLRTYKFRRATSPLTSCGYIAKRP